MNVKSQKQIAAKIMKTGISRVRVSSEKEVEEAITRNDIRTLITKGVIYKTRKKGITRIDAEHKRKQKKKGRRKGEGKKKGSFYSKKPKKTIWMEKIRPLRRLLRDLRAKDKLEEGNYRKLYLMAKGGFFRNKKHLLYYLKDHELMKVAAKPATKEARPAEKPEIKKEEPKKEVKAAKKPVKKAAKKNVKKKVDKNEKK
ncbi:MAG: 50S ribosomal protein L19e [Candidatus Aenigmarchaeota archaeon]|nr:50S ribosomal protein L19e [Candidatus Aenigmarchaeota archaeon]